MMKLLIGVVFVALLVVGSVEGHSRPVCPEKWPDWGFDEHWNGPVRSIDPAGDWIIFGDEHHYRAYRTSSQYAVGYVPGDAHETCYWSIGQQAQIVFQVDD